MENTIRKQKTRKYKYPPLGQARDVEGALWDVREVRSTKYGFDLLFGSRVTGGVSNITGLPKLIATQALVDFWEANRIQHTGVLFDLPAGRTTLKRVRARLSFHYHDDLWEFWQNRMNDLRTLSPSEFAARHSVPAAVVTDARFKFLGRQARELGWWQTPEGLEILQSNTTYREMGEKLGISISHVKRLRDRVLERDRWESELAERIVERWAA